MQCRIALWILEAFYTSSSFRIKAITGLIQIHLHLQLRTQSFCQIILSNHFLKKDTLISVKPIVYHLRI